MNPLFSKSNNELYKLGFKAAECGKDKDYDPFRNINFHSDENQKLKEKNDAWWKGYNDFKNQQK